MTACSRVATLISTSSHTFICTVPPRKRVKPQPRLLSAGRPGSMRGVRRNAIALAACIAMVGMLCFPAIAPGADWVIPGRGAGHGVGMSQYGAYGYAKHGSSYRSILSHYYRHTRLDKAADSPIRVLIATPPDSVGFSKATKACGKRLDAKDDYTFQRSGGDVLLRR